MLKRQNCNVTELVPRLGGMFCGEKLLVGFFLKLKGSPIDPSVFNKNALDKLVKEDKLIGALGFFTVEDNDQDAGTATSSRNEMIETMPGTKGYNFTFNNGSCFQNQLQKLHGSKNYEFIPIFDDGSALFAEMKDGKIKGFDVNIYVGTKGYQTSADVAGSILRVFITPNAMTYWQGSAYVYESDEFSFKEIEPIAGINIKLPVLVNGATTTVAKISNLCSDSAVSGLTTVANWKLERNGKLEAFTGSLPETNGNYTFTHAALNAGDKVRIMTNVSGYAVYPLDTSYYAGASNIIEVV